jgi:hypothetical protein
MIHCFECGSDVADGMAFCTNCGRPLDEAETVVRGAESNGPTFPSVIHPSYFQIIIEWLWKTAGATLLACLGLILIGLALAYVFDGQSVERNANESTATPTSVKEIVYIRETPTPKPTTQPSPASESLAMNRSATNAIQQMNVNRPSELPQLQIYKGHRMYDKNGRKLRAICKNGKPSYWQYDRLLVCGANGGIVELLW